MCIIAAKPAGVDMPSNDTLRTMWTANSDGAGFMYTENGAVRIEKGFMKYKNFITALNKVGNRLDLKATPMVFHFRITTHGGTRPENTHPFPISDNLAVLQKRRCSVDLGVAHNGIIYSVDPRKDTSDTMEYIMTQLAPLKRAVPNFYKSKDLRLMIENAIDSKMAFLTKDGKIYTIGHFIEDEGMLYSNYSYEPYSYRYGGGFDWESYYQDYYDYDCGCSYTQLVSSYEADKESTENKSKAKTAGKNADNTLKTDVIYGAFLTAYDYVITDTNQLRDPDDFLLADDEVTVYEYDSKKDVFHKRPGYIAMDQNGMPAHYDRENEFIAVVE